MSPSISARGVRAATESMTMTSRAPERINMSTDLEGLLSGVGLTDEEVVHVDADGARVDRVHGVLGVDVGTHPAVALGFGDDVHGEGRLTRGLGTVELDDAPTRQTTDTERHVEGEGAGGDRLDVEVHVLAHAHDRALTELLFDLAQRGVQGLRAIVGCH